MTPPPDRLFYDGHCGLCHRTVRFVLRRDAEGKAFRFAPLQSEAFDAATAGMAAEAIPESVAVQTARGELLFRSDAIVHILKRLGGAWRALGGAIGMAPRPLRDALYRVVARYRLRVFGTREEVCPIVTAEQRARFDL